MTDNRDTTRRLSPAMDSFLYAKDEKVHREAETALPPRRRRRRSISPVDDPKQTAPPTIRWKQSFLSFEDAIEAWQKENIARLLVQSTVVKLLDYHLDRCRELLWAEVNGGLDKSYQAELDKHEAGGVTNG